MKDGHCHYPDVPWVSCVGAGGIWGGAHAGWASFILGPHRHVSPVPGPAPSLYCSTPTLIRDPLFPCGKGSVSSRKAESLEPSLGFQEAHWEGGGWCLQGHGTLWLPLAPGGEILWFSACPSAPGDSSVGEAPSCQCRRQSWSRGEPLLRPESPSLVTEPGSHGWKVWSSVPRQGQT